MKLFDWIFDNKKEAATKPTGEVLDTTKVANQGREVYVVKPHRPVTKGGFPWEASARKLDVFKHIEERKMQERRLALMGHNW